jgi:hypothetical protein
VGFGGGIVGLVILAFDVIAILQVIDSRLDGTKKLLWILLIVFLPLVGMLLWFLLGKDSA